MIDLRSKGLPETIEIGGKPYSIHTDFRYWLKFYSLLQDGKTELKYYTYLFEKEIPVNPLTKEVLDFSNEFIEFFNNPNATPKGNGSSEKLIDYILDGEYIVASFMQVYGIDLTECDMHWHKFKALLISLPADCKMGQIMSDRGYKKETKKYEQLAEERKRDWTLPEENEQVSEEIIQSINDEFYATL